MTPEVVFIISSEKGKHKRKHAKKRKKENSLIRCHSALNIACLQNIQLDWPPTQDQKQFQIKSVSRRVYKSSWLPLSQIYYFAGLSNHAFSHNWPNIVFDCTERGISYNSRKKSRILIGKTKNSNLDRGKFQANHYFMLVQNKKEGRLNNVSNGSINSPSSFKRNFRWYCYYYYCL